MTNAHGARAGLVALGLALATGIAFLSLSHGPHGEPRSEGPGDPNATYVADEPVDVFHDGRFYPGRILAVHERTYHIRYDDFSASWNEWVTARRLRKRRARD